MYMYVSRFVNYCIWKTSPRMQGKRAYVIRVFILVLDQGNTSSILLFLTPSELGKWILDRTLPLVRMHFSPICSRNDEESVLTFV